MKTKLLRKFRARFDYKFKTIMEKCMITDKNIMLNSVIIYNIKKGSYTTYSWGCFSQWNLDFGTFMLQTFGISPSRKRRKLLEKKRIKDNHKRWKYEF